MAAVNATGLDGFGRPTERKQGRAGGGVRGVRLQRLDGVRWEIGWLRGALGRQRSGERFDFAEANDALVGNFPAEIFLLAALLVMLLEEDGTPGIGDER